ncbi:MAG: hypothetical protein DMG13_14855 [Acidobacteria bacterium]|nr:MAG: hypothetical protein DMG13_14855 [Acidobacteriota bacterium]
MKLRFRSCFVMTVVPLAVMSCYSCSSAPSVRESTPSKATFGPPAPNVMRYGDAWTEEDLRKAAAMPTPRTADGHPDMTGLYGPTYLERTAGLVGGPLTEGKTLKLGTGHPHDLDLRGIANFKNKFENLDAEVEAGRRPSYKPEYKQKAYDLMLISHREDPAIHCQPRGVPRVGPPDEIFQSPTAVVFLYSGAESWIPAFRAIPIDGTTHDEDGDPFPNGDSVGHWEGDTLVVDVTNISAETWLGGDGLIHSENLHVVERLTRVGDTLQYEVTVEDPTMFTKPWTPKPFALLRKKDGHGHAGEDQPCTEKSSAHQIEDRLFRPLKNLKK